jgi:hypothetical protein
LAEDHVVDEEQVDDEGDELADVVDVEQLSVSVKGNELS